MENKKLSNDIESNNDLPNADSDSLDFQEPALVSKIDSKEAVKTELDNHVKGQSNSLGKSKTVSNKQVEHPAVPKKTTKPPKLEDKPFEEFISKHLIPELKLSIEKKGTLVRDIKLINGNRPVVGGNCWMVFCEICEQRKFWLCFNKQLITSDKTILLAESNSDPSIVESFLIDEKKTTLPLLVSRVIQRLNGQKWLGAN